MGNQVMDQLSYHNIIYLSINSIFWVKSTWKPPCSAALADSPELGFLRRHLTRANAAPSAAVSCRGLAFFSTFEFNDWSVVVDGGKWWLVVVYVPTTGFILIISHQLTRSIEVPKIGFAHQRRDWVEIGDGEPSFFQQKIIRSYRKNS